MRTGEALLALLLLPGQAPAPQATPMARARAYTVVGELVRVDLGERTVVVRSAEQPPREHVLRVEEATRITWNGRLRRLEELRPGERAIASVSEDAPGRTLLRSLKLGPSRYAAPPASPSPRP